MATGLCSRLMIISVPHSNLLIITGKSLDVAFSARKLHVGDGFTWVSHRVISGTIDGLQPMTAGEQLGPYRIEAPIGEGGMGMGNRAQDTRLDRTVARVSGAIPRPHATLANRRFNAVRPELFSCCHTF